MRIGTPAAAASRRKKPEDKWTCEWTAWKQPAEQALEPPGKHWPEWAVVNCAAQGMDLAVEHAAFAGDGAELHAESPAVDAPQEVQQTHLHAAAVHGADKVQDPAAAGS